MDNLAIRTENLTKYYGLVRGIDKLNLEVGTGEFFGFIGPNGSGKSTTIRTLLGLISPKSGKAEVLGMSPEKERKAILERVGYLPSDTKFYSGMRVKEILKLSADLRRKDCGARAAELCERLELDTGKKVETLSYGNRKKVGIISALQHDPELVILDEPTGGLDPLMQHEFFTILHERNREGATVFLSSHVLSEIQRHCTRAAVIREGSIIACDSVETLTKSSARKVTLRGNLKPEDLPEAENWAEIGGVISFLYSGKVSSLIRSLADADVEDLAIGEPDLEESVLRYYGKGGEQA